MIKVKVYKNVPQLVKWLKTDLRSQKKKIAKNKNIKENEVKDEELTLNIGHAKNIEPIQNYEYKEVIYTKINFEFNFKDILKELFKLEKKELKYDENEKILCPYKVNATRVTFSKEANFSDTIFSDESDFFDSFFSGKAIFFNTTFSGKAYFTASTFSKEASFSNTIFSEGAYFARSIFSGTGYFFDSIFNGETYFNYSTFSGKAYFSESTFSGEAYFSESIFNGEITFNNIKFEENENKDEISIKFNNIKLENNSYIIFNNINYDDKKKEFIENENSKIEIINTVINGRLDFNNVFLSKLNLEGSNIVGIFNRINLKAYPSNSDTACILKNEELKKNNTIKALEFKAIEKDLYTKELRNKKDKTPENWAEIVSLKISKLSNNHGQNWFRAVGFTLGFGFLFFSLSYLFISNVNIYNIKYMFTGRFMKNYFNYLIPTNFELIKNVYENTNIFFYIFYIAGKISVGYGIVEIVQAFRKLNAKV